jgi:hypothetical protein
VLQLRDGVTRPFRRFCIALSIGLVVQACATRGFVRPVGTVTPVPDAEASAAWESATRACADVRLFNADVRPSGRLGDTRVRATSLLVAVGAAGQIGLEASVANQTQFVLKGDASQATLVLPRENRMVTASAADILHALIGLDAGPERLLSIFSGCVAVARAVVQAERIGGLMRITTPDAVVFLRVDRGAWRPVAGEFDGWLVDYRRFGAGSPAVIGIRSPAGREPAVDLTLTVRDALLNPDLPPAAFAIVVPPGTEPAEVQDLRLLGSTD